MGISSRAPSPSAEPCSSRGRPPGRALGLVSALALLTACAGSGRQTADSPQPVDPDRSRAEDADALPAFGSADSHTPDPDGEPERFVVELGDAPTRGPDDAEVTIVMFSDFECPFCQRGHETLLELERRHRGKVRIAYKAFPLANHPHALLAAMAARTAQDQGKFWEFHDLLYSGRGIDTDAVFSYAKQVGVNPKALSRDLDALEYGPDVRRDMRQGRRLGVNSTPTFFINGRHVSGAKPIEEFEAIVADELQRAERWKAQGVAPQKLYEHATRDGYTKVAYSKGRRGLDPDGVFPVPLGDSPTQGPNDAPITVVVFGDFQCPFCARGHQTMQELLRDYAGKLRVVYKHKPLPFHSFAFVAARASMAAHAQGKFWAYHDALYARGGDVEEDTLYAIAKEVGLNMKQFKAAMGNLDLDQAIEQDLGLAAALGITGTPAYFVNGRPIEGALPSLEFRLLFEEELERAKVLRESGVSKADLYERLTNTPIE